MHRTRNRHLIGGAIAGWVALWSWGSEAVSAPFSTEEASLATLKSESGHCQLGIEPLMEAMLDELPDYANRVIQRSRLGEVDGASDRAIYVILAGRAEFDPIESDLAALDDSVEQVFFTTLERHYRGDRVATVQNYHRLFLTLTPSGWRLAALYTRFGTEARDRPALPPEETSNGSIGQAARLWLRDCRSGAVRRPNS